MINGQGFGKSHDGELQFNHMPFAGCIPCATGFDCQQLPDPTFESPQPASIDVVESDSAGTTDYTSDTEADSLTQESGSDRSALVQVFVICVVPLLVVLAIFDVSRYFN